jgi:hypothetical protein
LPTHPNFGDIQTTITDTLRDFLHAFLEHLDRNSLNVVRSEIFVEQKLYRKLNTDFMSDTLYCKFYGFRGT